MKAIFSTILVTCMSTGAFAQSDLSDANAAVFEIHNGVSANTLCMNACISERIACLGSINVVADLAGAKDRVEESKICVEAYLSCIAGCSSQLADTVSEVTSN